MTTAPSIELRHHTDITPVRQTLLDVYGDVRAPLLHLPHYAVDAFAERLDRHAAEPGFETVVAYDHGDAVGYAYCNTVEPGNRWWKRMNPPLPEHLTAAPAVALKEIMVRVPWRGTGTALRIHNELLAHRPEQRVSLLVNPAAGDGKVQRLYETWGYETVSAQQPSPGSPPLAAMIRNIR
ncbi:GNAT family N-acetyltransferase [Streptomyces xanthochromogenes]|uniref:GNAT family N-acetyltransferase n=1 Tax=Streptomyces xanthochromogenes TaxID=67384 RepID=UPI003449548F